MNTPAEDRATGTTILLHTLRAKGVRGTCRAIGDRVEEWILRNYFEWRLGIRTAGDVSPEAPGDQRSEFSDYGPSAYGNIQRIIKALQVHRGTDVLIDFGSGKGRVLAMAAMYPFGRIIGVERSPHLNDIARQNIDRARRWLRCTRLDIVTADAAAYPIPDDVTIVYFASPFRGSTLDAVLDNVKASLMRAPRPLRVVSHGADAVNPFERQIRACDWLDVRLEVRLQRSNFAWIYENSRWRVPPAVSAR